MGKDVVGRGDGAGNREDVVGVGDGAGVGRAIVGEGDGLFHVCLWLPSWNVETLPLH